MSHLFLVETGHVLSLTKNTNNVVFHTAIYCRIFAIAKVIGFIM
jgi:hypothetical protein